MSHVPLLLVLAVTYSNHWTFLDIGFKYSGSWVWALTAGFVAASIFGIVHRIVQRALPISPANPPTVFDIEILKATLPRGSKAHAVQCFETTLLSPILEDLIYRGFFVFYFGSLTGNPAAAVLVGLVLCVAVHLYMGGARLLSILMFYTASITLLYSPFGLMSTIVFHIVCNTRYMMHRRTHALQYMMVAQDLRRRTDGTD
ncbi:MAG: hypothetical protein Aurels2KO_04290 [Aureliella sp.]